MSMSFRKDIRMYYFLSIRMYLFVTMTIEFTQFNPKYLFDVYKHLWVYDYMKSFQVSPVGMNTSTVRLSISSFHTWHFIVYCTDINMHEYIHNHMDSYCTRLDFPHEEFHDSAGVVLLRGPMECIKHWQKTYYAQIYRVSMYRYCKGRRNHTPPVCYLYIHVSVAILSKNPKKNFGQQASWCAHSNGLLGRLQSESCVSSILNAVESLHSCVYRYTILRTMLCKYSDALLLATPCVPGDPPVSLLRSPGWGTETQTGN